jgi:NAD-dependent dihydropyrimidine dehydrogenase PreA subunit
MEIRVDGERCTGCGDCLEACPNDAIGLDGGRAVINQASCTDCQTCIDVCPTGAISTVEVPAINLKPVTVQSDRETEIMTRQPAQMKPWLGALLDFAGREILPRLVESLTLALERREAQTPAVPTQALLPDRYDGSFREPRPGWDPPGRRRSGQARRHQRGRERGRRKGFGKKTLMSFTKGGEEHATR